ncbi:AI-2E family transporter, partial [bacterium]|nr:AI-2E family transporter [bacterium]
MGLLSHNKFKYALIILLGLFIFLWYFLHALTPFIVGGVIAYLLDPFIKRLEKLGVKRLFSVILICLLFLSTLVCAVLFIFPIIFQQLLELFKSTPSYIFAFQEYFFNNFPSLQDKTPILSESLNGFSEMIESKGVYLAQALVTSTVGLVNIFTFFLIVPVVTFYLLLDWTILIEKLNGLVPKKYNSAIKIIALEIDKTLASFVRGQLFICLILSIYYAVALMFLGIKFAILVGIFAGIFSL